MKRITKNSIIIIINLLMIFSSLINFTYASNNTIDDNYIIENLEIIGEKNVSNTRSTEPPYPGDQELHGRLFFIKNAYTGQYLDVAGGVAANGTNIQQYKYNGTQAQMWYVYSYGNGDFSLLTPLGNDGTYLYALDISDGSSANLANAQIYGYNATDAQKFCIAKTTYGGSYIVYTKCSGYEKAITLNGATCNQGGNVNQYTFQSAINQLWIFEPAVRDDDMGIWYAKYNYNQYVAAYPKLTAGQGTTGDCANFVSQCMLASGIHFQNDWWVYRKNGNYSAPNGIPQLNDTWELADPSPWISAVSFAEYWKEQRTIYYCKGSYITENPDEIANLDITEGDVIQYATSFLGRIRRCRTYYVYNWNGNI